MTRRRLGGPSGNRGRWPALAVLAMTCGLLPGLSVSTNYTVGCNWLALDGGAELGGGLAVVDLLTGTGLEGGLHASANYSVDTVGCLEVKISTAVAPDVWKSYR